MFHFQKDIDAWRRHTKRLSATEKGVYGELLDELYALEQPLPNDMEDLCRIAGVSKPDERKALDKVLARFFELTDAGYVQERALEEIANYQAGAEKNRENGKKGGRPPKKRNPNETQTKPSGLFLGSENTPKNTDFENPNHNPNERQSGNPVIRKANNPSAVGDSESEPRVNESPPPPAIRTIGDWTPKPQTVEFLRSPLHGIPEKFMLEQIGEFVTYWRDRNLPAASWDSKFIQRCVGEWKRHGASWSANPGENHALDHRSGLSPAGHKLAAIHATIDYDAAKDF